MRLSNAREPSAVSLISIPHSLSVGIACGSPEGLVGAAGVLLETVGQETGRNTVFER